MQRKLSEHAAERTRAELEEKVRAIARGCPDEQQLLAWWFSTRIGVALSGGPAVFAGPGAAGGPHCSVGGARGGQGAAAVRAARVRRGGAAPARVALLRRALHATAAYCCVEHCVTDWKRHKRADGCGRKDASGPA
jgi:hypothetical protein